MPIYSYKCSSCEFEDDELQSLKDKPFTKCPSCGKKTYKRIFGAAHPHFKGRGFHKTDYESSNHLKQGNPLMTVRDRQPETGDYLN